MNTIGIPYWHLAPLDVSCPSCDADEGQPCAEPRYGMENILTDYHDARYATADLHEVHQWRQAPDSDVWVGICADCGEEVDR